MQKLTETSLTRIHQHTKNRNIGMVSAFRSMYDLSDNLRRTSLLEADIKSSGFAFIKMKGRYIEGYGTEPPSGVYDQGSLGNSIVLVAPKDENYPYGGSVGDICELCHQEFKVVI